MNKSKNTWGIDEHNHWFWWDDYLRQEFILTGEIKSIEKQIEYISKAASKTKEEIESTQRKLIKDVRNDRQYDTLMDHLENEWYINYQLDSFMREAICLLIFSYIERKLHSLSKTAFRVLNPHLKVPEKVKNKVLSEYWKYLQKSDGPNLDLSSYETNFKIIKDNLEVRRRIAHANGGNPKITEIKNTPGLQNQTLKIEEVSYLNFLLEKANFMFAGILQAISSNKRLQNDQNT